MDFSLSPTAEELRTRLLAFMDEHVYPAEAVYRQQLADAGDPHAHPPVMEELKAEARRRGLWNLFLPHKTQWTDGLSNLDYAPLAEVMGRSPIASEACNCSAPDTGNMEILTMFGTPEQQEQWLHPLLEGEIRSCFAMTEPAVAVSDATNIACRIERDGDDYVINGAQVVDLRRGRPTLPRSPSSWARPTRTRPATASSRWCSSPSTRPGVDGSCARCPCSATGPGGPLRDPLRRTCGCPQSNILGEEGGGFAIAQARLGPGRIHHCMRAIGAAERALELMCRRVTQRVAFGKTAVRAGRDPGVDRRRPDGDRPGPPLTMYTAWLMDTEGNKAARVEISASR